MGMINEGSNVTHLMLRKDQKGRHNLETKDGETCTSLVGTLAGVKEVETENGSMYCIKVFDNHPDPDGNLEEYVIWLNGRGFIDFGVRALAAEVKANDLVKLTPFGIPEDKYTKWGCGLAIAKDDGNFEKVSITKESAGALDLPVWEKKGKFYSSEAQELEIFARLSKFETIGSY